MSRHSRSLSQRPRRRFSADLLPLLLVLVPIVHCALRPPKP
ncbi:MAG: hypothetical protein ABIP94_11200 [Planctomycetota bacterium]